MSGYQRTYLNQFHIENRPCHIPAFILSECEDRSWGNETCPHFESEALMLCFWIDFDNPEDREWDDGKKYNVVEVIDFEEGEIGDETIFATDSEEELIAFCREHQLHKAMRRATDELAAVLEGLYQLPESPFNQHRIALMESVIDDFNEACTITDEAETPDCSPAGERQ